MKNNKFQGPNKVTIIFEEYRDGCYNELDRIESCDFKFFDEPNIENSKKYRINLNVFYEKDKKNEK